MNIFFRDKPKNLNIFEFFFGFLGSDLGLVLGFFGSLGMNSTQTQRPKKNLSTKPSSKPKPKTQQISSKI